MSDRSAVTSTTGASPATVFIPPSPLPAGFSFRSSANDGLLLSHALLGTFFFLLGVWRFYGLPIFRSRDLKLGPLRATVLAAIVKLVFCLMGILVETVFTIHAAYAHHNVYGGFALAAATELINSLGIILPEGLEDAAQVLAFAVLGLIARAQAYGEVYLTGAARLLTSHTALFNAGIGALHQANVFRSYCRYSPLIGQLRAGGILLQGVWFWHAGAILRSPDRWAEQEHDNIMHLSIVFVWDACAIALIYSFVTAFVGWLTRGRYEQSAADVSEAGKLIRQDAKKTYIPLRNSKMETETALTPKDTESI